MKLYKISQDLNNGYDTYDSAIVCAENEDEAKKIHPSEHVKGFKDEEWFYKRDDGTEYETENGDYSSWVQVSQINSIIVKYLGEADKDLDKGVILASFNAG